MKRICRCILLCSFRSCLLKGIWEGGCACHTFAFHVVAFPILSTPRKVHHQGGMQEASINIYMQLASENSGSPPLSQSGRVKFPPSWGLEWNLSVIIMGQNSQLSRWGSWRKRNLVKIRGWHWPTISLQISLCEGSSSSCRCVATSLTCKASLCEEMECSVHWGAPVWAISTWHVFSSVLGFCLNYFLITSLLIQQSLLSKRASLHGFVPHS